MMSLRWSRAALAVGLSGSKRWSTRQTGWVGAAPGAEATAHSHAPLVTINVPRRTTNARSLGESPRFLVGGEACTDMVVLVAGAGGQSVAASNLPLAGLTICRRSTVRRRSGRHTP